MDSNLLKIEIVIPVYNRRDTTLQSLRSLSRINKDGLNVHIIIVDDGSTDGTSEAIEREFPEVQIIKGDGTLHYAAGTNRGIEAALKNEPDYIVCMNDDTVVHSEFLQRMLKTAKANPRSVVGALLLLWDQPHRVFQVAPHWDTFKGGWQHPDDLTAFTVPQTAFEVEGIVGNCVLYPVEVIREVGLMDEKRFPHGWGDIQYTVKMRKAGWKLLIEPKAYVWNEPNTYPKPLHTMPKKEILKTLFVNRRHPVNLHRQFIARWESAPTKIASVVGFCVYLLTLAGKFLRFSLKGRTPNF
jgi:Predicted glycosyltransferases